MKSRMLGRRSASPWHILNFLPDPQGHGALRGVLAHSSLTTVCCLAGRSAWRAPAPRSTVADPDERRVPAGAPPAAARAKPEPDASSDDDV